MSYRPSVKLTVGRALALGGWTALIFVLFGLFLLFYTFGDCADDLACQTYKARAGNVIVWTSFAVYWAGFAALVWRWSRK